MKHMEVAYERRQILAILSRHRKVTQQGKSRSVPTPPVKQKSHAQHVLKNQLNNLGTSRKSNFCASVKKPQTSSND